MNSEIFLNEDAKNSGEWFLTTIKYEGHGKASFSDPELTVEGYVTIKFDEFGNQEIIMDVDNVEIQSPDVPNIPDEFRLAMLMQLLSGERPKKQQVMGTINVAKWSSEIGGTRTNPCKKLLVATLNGIFLSEKNIGYDISLSIHRHSGFSAQLKFHISDSVFRADDSHEAKYWVLPLMNFISAFRDYSPDLDFHPLRVSRSLVYYELSSKNIEIIKNYFDSDKRVILFYFLNKLGFIDHISDYREKEKMLLNGKAQCIITSLMVSETPSTIKIYDFDDLKCWFPFQFLDMLGLASGTEIGAPWIEFRDARGILVCRIHVALNNPWFSSGHRAIEENIHHGIGSLLTRSQYSLHIGNSYLTAVLKHLVRSGMGGLLFEDGMAHLFQALDCLCEEFGLNIQRLTEDLNDSQKSIIKFELNSLSYRIRCQSTLVYNPEQKNILIRIADKVMNSDNHDRNFGLAVVDLIKLFDLSDTIIVESFYKSNPRKDGRPWYSVLSHYRGVVMHSSYFDFERGLYDFQDVATVRSHLHDILIRIVLNMLCYDCTYQKAIRGLTGRYPLNWVNPSLKAEVLGYEK